MYTSSNNENHLVLLKVTVNDLQSPRSFTCFLNLPLFDVYHLIKPSPDSCYKHAHYCNGQYTSLIEGLHAGNPWPSPMPWRQVLPTKAFFDRGVLGAFVDRLVGGSW